MTILKKNTIGLNLMDGYLTVFYVKILYFSRAAWLVLNLLTSFPEY